MPTGSENFTRNARLAFERRQKERQSIGQEYTINDLAREMVPHLFTEKQLQDIAAERGQDYKDVERQKVETAALQLRRYMGFASGPEPKNASTRARPIVWASKYQEAFAYAMTIPLERLRALDYDQAKLPEADWANFFAQALGKRLKPSQIKVVVGQLKRALARPGMFELLAQVCEAILSADNADAANAAANRILTRIRSWPSEEESKVRPKKVRQTS